MKDRHDDNPPETRSLENNSLHPEDWDCINREERILTDVLASLEELFKATKAKLKRDSDQARELHHKLVATRRDEDRQQLSSEEAVARAISDRRRDSLGSLDKLLDRPYFARLEVEEKDPQGRTIRREYKIGFETNVENRIIDWRHAPLSRLYYSYQEGEEFFEEIQGTEREGVISKKVRTEITAGKLHHIQVGEKRYTRLLTADDQGAEWQCGTANPRGRFYQLPDVLALITPEQFQTITREPESPLLIQGVAGSGKTSVGMYRVSWLVTNQSYDPKETAIIVKNPILKTYLGRTAAGLGSGELPVLGYSEWVLQRLSGSTSVPSCLRSRHDKPVQEVGLIRSSQAYLTCLKTKAAEHRSPPLPSTGNWSAQTWDAMMSWFLELQSLSLDGLGDAFAKRAIDLLRDRIKAGIEDRVLDYSDLPLLVCVLEGLKIPLFLPSGRKGKFKHLVIDEVQDLSEVLLLTVRSAVEKSSDLTLLGDDAQTLHHGWVGWKALGTLLGVADVERQLVKLAVSFRCTVQVMRLAQFALNGRPTCNKGRTGRPPLVYLCDKEDKALVFARDWTLKALERYPHDLMAVLCKSDAEAQYVYELLRPTLGNSVQLAADDSIENSDGVLIATIRSVKGLEFKNVLLWNVSARNYRPEGIDRNLLYVGITRAEENLCVVTWGTPSRLLPRAESKMIRVVEDFDEPEDSAGQRKSSEKK